MIRTKVLPVITLIMAIACVSLAQEDDSTDDLRLVSDIATGNAEQTTLLNRVAQRIEEKQQRIDELRQLARSQENGLSEEEAAELEDLAADVDRLRRNLVLAVSGQSTLNAIYQEEAPETTWQEDVVDILKPLADSLKNLTRKPRQIAELRASLEVLETRQQGFSNALENFAELDTESLSAEARGYVESLQAEWQEELNQTAEEQLLISQQLQELEGENDEIVQSFLPNLKAFSVGPALTLLIAVAAAVATYFLTRAIWWLYSTKVASKDFRRRSTVYRFLNYSYQLITVIVVIVVVLLVLYLREELLLLALAFLLLAGVILNLRQYLPRYIAEARTLLNLGGVREEERVIYNGLPWMVRSINIYSVLHNPALDGIIRLPLAELDELVSRPVKNNLWFPTQRGDYVLLPDGLLGQVKVQTPDLVELSVKGGMTVTYPTSDFYNLSVINLSRDGNFGVSVTFGLDYSLQGIALDKIPATLKAAIEAQLEESGFAARTRSLIVELSAAGASSLDYLVFATFDKSLAGQYYALERLLLQTCVSVSNKEDWTIPFPQLTIHQQREAS